MIQKISVSLLSTLLATFIFFSPELKAESALDDFSLISVMHEGRVKPLGTFAQIKLNELYGKKTISGLSATEWLAEVLFNPKQAYSRKIFRIINNDVKAALSLKAEEKYFTFIEIYTAFGQNQKLISNLFSADPAGLDLTSNQIKDLYNHFSDYMGLSRSFSFFSPEFKEGEKIFSYFDMLSQNKFSSGARNNLSFKKFMEEDAQFDAFTVIQVLSKEDSVWLSPWKALLLGHEQNLQVWERMYQNYSGNPKAFNSEAAKLQQTAGLSQFKAELFIRKHNFIYYALSFYILSFLLLSVYFLKPITFIRSASFTAMLTGGLFHLTLVILRSFILGRPPVTNLYESILFVGLTSVFFASVFEWKRKNSLGLFIGSVLGTVLLFLSIGYEQTGDNLSMIVAVLDTNFWLATHVVTISIGYGCALVASLMAHYYLYRMNKESTHTLAILEKNIHGTVLFALFFTVLGTILGGIWADQSWGRFWGWDPKENGALLICLWLLWITHARLQGRFRKASFAYFTALTSIIVIMAWFGVNLLNVGLHTYGFSSDAARGLFLFSGAEFFILTLLYIAGKKKFLGSLSIENNEESL